jgi:uncharacterized membrane protein
MFGKLRTYRTEVECVVGPVYGKKHNHTYTVKARNEKEARQLARERYANGDFPADSVTNRINVRKA